MRNSSPISQLLKQHFLKKKKASRYFSLRSLAVRLSISPSYLSQILNGRRILPSGLVEPICEMLDIDQDKKEVLIAKLLRSHGWTSRPADSLRTTHENFESHNKAWEALPASALSLLSDWKNVVILEATQLRDYDGSAEFLSARLGFSTLEIERSIEQLSTSQLLQKNSNGLLVKSKNFLEFQSKLDKKMIVKFHQETLDLAKNIILTKISENDVRERIVSSATFTCSKAQVPLIRAQIAEFLKTVASEASSTAEEEIYQFSVQFFPHTQKK